jgi:integrase
MLEDAVASGLSPQTAGHIRAVLRTALNRAERYGLIVRNAAADAYPIKIRRRERAVLHVSQVETLLSGIRGEPLEALYALAISTGMREGELLGLRWRDIDLDTGTVQVEEQLQRIEGRLERVPTKTAASKRAIGIPLAVISILRRHRARQSEERLPQDDGYVFARHDGQPLYPELVIKKWHALTDRLGLPRLTFHDLRGTAASHMHALGAELKVIQAALGHTDGRTTMNLYTHALPDGLRANADRMNVLFESEA